jgi:F-type H+-transporting ATPase subunit a
MDFDQILTHHLLDHRILRLFSLGGIDFSLTKHLLMMWGVGSALLISLSWLARTRSEAGLLARTGLEVAVLFIRDEIVVPSLGHSGRKYLDYFLTLFFFILLCNLAGMVPYGATATGNVGVTAALASCTFGLILLGGIREQGLLGFLRHIVPSGVPWVLYPLMFLVEVIGLFAKCFALTIRLFANMIAGHIVVLGFLSLIFTFAAASKAAGLSVAPFSVALAIFVNAIEVLVCLLQAYIFTMLTAVFVGGALHPH